MLITKWRYVDSLNDRHQQCCDSNTGNPLDCIPQNCTGSSQSITHNKRLKYEVSDNHNYFGNESRK